jgi:hypothetical protein
MKTLAREQALYLADLLRAERATLAEFLVALAEFDRKRLWLEIGHRSLFYFLHRELGLAKGPAFYRKTAAELIQRYPEIVEPLRDGRLCLTSVVELAKVITPENRAEVLPRFFHRSKQEARAVTAELQPEVAPPLRAVVTVVRAPVAASALASSPAIALRPPDPAPATATLVLPEEPARANAGVPDVACAPRPAPPSADVEPLTAELRRLHVTVSRRLLEKLDAARDALSHSHPGASPEEIIETGLDLILQRHAKRKGLVEKPRKEPPPKRTPSAPSLSRRGTRREHVPAHVKRAVWKRDGGRCQWPLESGGICGSTHQVELDHVETVARGGPSTIANMRLLCRPHQDFAARKVFGDEWMNRFTRDTRSSSTSEARIDRQS